MSKMKISDVKISDRKRLVKNIDSLAESIHNSGLINPITVDKSGKLIAGLHRLEACKQLGWGEIPVTILDIDGLEAELAEIDENIIREDLTDLEYAEHLQRRKEIYEELYPESKAEEQRKKGLNISSETISSLEEHKTFVKDTAEKTGKSERSIQQDIQIANNIPDEVKEEIKGSKIEDNKTDLLELARIEEPEKKLEAVKQVKSGQIKSVREFTSKNPISNPKNQEKQDKIIISSEEYAELKNSIARLKTQLRKQERQSENNKILEQSTDNYPETIIVNRENHTVIVQKEYRLPTEYEIKESDTPEKLLHMAKNYEENQKNVTNINLEGDK